MTERCPTARAGVSWDFLLQQRSSACRLHGMCAEGVLIQKNLVRTYPDVLAQEALREVCKNTVAKANENPITNNLN